MVAGRPGQHVLVEIKGRDGNRLVCGPKATALEACANILNGYVEPGKVEVGEAVGIRLISDVYALKVESGVVRLGFFTEGAPVLDSSGSFKPPMLWLEGNEVCPLCRVKLEPRSAA